MRNNRESKSVTMLILQALRKRAEQLKTEILALSLAARPLETPWLAGFLITVIVAYALSPIDPIPDFIPVFGYLDDLLLIPIGIYLVLKMVPPQVLAEGRKKAQEDRRTWTTGETRRRLRHRGNLAAGGSIVRGMGL